MIEREASTRKHRTRKKPIVRYERDMEDKDFDLLDLTLRAVVIVLIFVLAGIIESLLGY